MIFECQLGHFCMLASYFVFAWILWCKDNFHSFCWTYWLHVDAKKLSYDGTAGTSLYVGSWIWIRKPYLAGENKGNLHSCVCSFVPFASSCPQLFSYLSFLNKNFWRLSLMQVLDQQYASIRRTRGDGNCFFRSFMFSYLVCHSTFSWCLLFLFF